MKPPCSACSGPLAPHGLDLGFLPLSHDLSCEPQVGLQTFRSIPFHLVQCPACALVQSLEPPRAEDLVPRGDWVAFNEPSLHLDELALKILSLSNTTETSTLAGISSKDDSLLEMLAAKSRATYWRIDPTKDAGFSGNSAGVSWLQDVLGIRLANHLRSTRGGVDILVARHFLEHASQLPRVVSAMMSMLNPGGHVVMEVPDCESGLRLGDDSILWEEHHICFTAATLRRAMRLAGLEIVWSTAYPFPNETCLVVIATPASPIELETSPPTPEEFDTFSSFVEGFPERCLHIRHQLETWRSHGQIAIYGAGHHANTFLHAHRITDLIDLVIDDNPHKTGKYMPGTVIPVLSSDRLRWPEVSVCLSSLGFSAEQRVVSASQHFTNAGGAFYSIFPENNRSPFRWLAGKHCQSDD